MKVRIKFKKDGVMRFVGHLDLMRFFQKLFRRADIPVALTKGFSPHMIMSFASPLAIGSAGEGEYLDVELTRPVDSADALCRLNAHSVPGVEILSFRRISDEKKMTAMTILDAAAYRLTVEKEHVPVPEDILSQLCEEFLAMSSCLMEKKTKRKTAETDIRPLVYEFSLLADGAVYLLCAAGSRENIRPELVVRALEMLAGETPQSYEIGSLTRLDMYTRRDGRLVCLDDLGTDMTGQEEAHE